MFVAGAVILSATTLATAQMAKTAQKKAAKKAAADALEAEKQARKAEIFAETEGEGIGDLGKISLEVDDELDEDEEISSGNLRI